MTDLTDARLRTLAGRALDDRAATVDLDLEFARLRERLAHQARPPQRRWQRWALAAAVVVLATGGVVALAVVPRGADDLPGPIELDPPGTLVATSIPVEPTVSTTGPPATESTAPGPTEPLVDPGPSDLGTINVVDVWEIRQPTRTVLHTTSHGDAPDQLGLEPCSECNGLAPWAPIELADGRIVVPDNYKQRWFVLDGGEASSVPFAFEGSPVAQPILAGGRIYALVPDPEDHTGAFGDVYVFDVDDLATPFDVVEVPRHVRVSVYSMIEMTNAGLMVNQRGPVIPAPLPGVPGALPKVDWHRAGDVAAGAVIDVTWQGEARHWAFPVGWFPYGLGSSAMPTATFDDGSVLLTADDSDDPTVPSPTRYVIRLNSDGTAVAYPIEWWGGGENGSQTVTSGSILTIEWQANGEMLLVRYDLP